MLERPSPLGIKPRVIVYFNSKRQCIQVIVEMLETRAIILYEIQQMQPCGTVVPKNASESPT